MSYRLVRFWPFSDKGSRGEREDRSEPRRCRAGCSRRAMQVCIPPPDERRLSSRCGMSWRACAMKTCRDLLLTTGGHGLFAAGRGAGGHALPWRSATRPAIAEAIRRAGIALQIAPPAGTAQPRRQACSASNTLIVNLPGSEKAVRENLSYILPSLSHGLGILTGRESECGGEHHHEKEEG